jgi:hypothetical protein
LFVIPGRPAASSQAESGIGFGLDRIVSSATSPHYETDAGSRFARPE